MQPGRRHARYRSYWQSAAVWAEGAGCGRPGRWVWVPVSGEGCAVVAAVGVITLATNARVGLGLGPLAHVRRGESGLGGIEACASPGIVSASWSVSLASESSSKSVTKAVSLGRKDSRTGTLSFLGVSSGGFSGEGIALTFAVFPDEPTQTNPSSPSQKSTLLPW